MDRIAATRWPARLTSGPARALLWIAVTALLAFAPALGLGVSSSRQLLLIALLSLVVSGLNLSFGYAGELSFAQPAMYAVGAYTTVIVSLRWTNDLALVLVVAAVAGLLLGLVSGIPGLRLGGWMLAIISLFLVLLVPDLVSAAKKWTGGHQGASGIPIPKLFGSELDTDDYLAVVIIVTSAWFALFRNLIRSRTGNSLSVLRQSPILASSLGISVYSTKLKAYALSGLPAALAGAFFGYLDGFVAPDTFGVQLAIAVLAASILGGARSVYGVFVGAALLQLGPMQSSAFGDYAFVAYGAFLLVAGVALQRGISGLGVDLLRLARSRWRSPATAGASGTATTTTAATNGVATAPSTAVPAAGATAAPAATGTATPGTARGDLAALPELAGQRLAVDGVGKRFGGVAALTDVSFAVEPGEVVALIGPNGSGKTTLLNIISGYYRVDEGSVHVGDRRTTGLPPHRIARAGIARTFQTPSIPSMSVREVVESARTHVSRVSILETMLRLPRHRRVVAEDARRVEALLSAVGLAGVAGQDAQSLPLGTRRLLELARALAAEPGVLLLDEVASGLDDEELEELSAIIRAVRASGGSVLLVEHNFSLVRALADRVVVLSRGRVVVVETPEAAAAHPEVLEHYLGQPAAAGAAAGGDRANPVGAGTAAGGPGSMALPAGEGDHS